jgi:hypothetical protein
MIHGAGLLGGATFASNAVILSPREGAALVVVSPQMLRFPYHTRYELIEFAVFTLAARAQRLVPLHAACVGLDGRGILLMGPSGAGKSTVALHCLLNGFDFLSEDSVFVAPDTMLATGVANFLHVRADSLGWLGRSREAGAIAKSPVIQRRSGVKKASDPFSGTLCATWLDLAGHQRKTLQEMKVRASQRKFRMLRVTQVHELGVVTLR